MSTFSASLHADALGRLLLTAHAHSGTEAAPEWEIFDLTRALETFEKLSETIPAVRARLALLKNPIEEAA